MSAEGKAWGHTAQSPGAQEGKTRVGALKPGPVQWPQAGRSSQRKGVEAEKAETPTESDGTATPRRHGTWCRDGRSHIMRS